MQVIEAGCGRSKGRVSFVVLILLRPRAPGSESPGATGEAGAPRGEAAQAQCGKAGAVRSTPPGGGSLRPESRCSGAAACQVLVDLSHFLFNSMNKRPSRWAPNPLHLGEDEHWGSGGPPGRGSHHASQ